MLVVSWILVCQHFYIGCSKQASDRVIFRGVRGNQESGTRLATWRFPGLSARTLSGNECENEGLETEFLGVHEIKWVWKDHL